MMGSAAPGLLRSLLVITAAEGPALVCDRQPRLLAWLDDAGTSTQALLLLGALAFVAASLWMLRRTRAASVT